MPYYKLPHTDGAVMFFPHGRPDLEPADPPEVEEPQSAAPDEHKRTPKRPSRQRTAKSGDEPEAD